MSNLELRPAPQPCGGNGRTGPVRDVQPGKQVPLGESTVVRRLLPNLGRRMVGAWCFVDHYGPDDIADEPGMQVPPHPHMGLQTVSWLHEGEVLHRDSLGSLQTVRPRELGLMTSGRAIAHSEESPHGHGPLLHGAQLWVALPGRTPRHRPALRAPHRPAGGHRRRRTLRHRHPRRTGRRHLARHHLLPAGRRRPHPRRRHGRPPAARPRLRVRGADHVRRERGRRRAGWPPAPSSTSAAAAPNCPCAPTPTAA